MSLFMSRAGLTLRSFVSGESGRALLRVTPKMAMGTASKADKTDDDEFISGVEEEMSKDGMDEVDIEEGPADLNTDAMRAEASRPPPQGGERFNDSAGRLFVGNLAWATDEVALSRSFSHLGNVVDAHVVRTLEDQRSRGFGFVTFDSVESAEKALEEMQGAYIDGRDIRLDRARPKTRRSMPSYPPPGFGPDNEGGPQHGGFAGNGGFGGGGGYRRDRGRGGSAERGDYEY